MGAMSELGGASTIIYGVSLAFHVGLAIAVASIDQAPSAKREVIAISMTEGEEEAAGARAGGAAEGRRDAATEARAPAKAKAAAAPTAEAGDPRHRRQPPATPRLDALPDFGLSLSAARRAGTGIAVPAGRQPGSGPGAPAAAHLEAASKLAPKPVDDCTEPIVKPKPRSTPRPRTRPRARGERRGQGARRGDRRRRRHGDLGARAQRGSGTASTRAALAAAKRDVRARTRCGKAVTATRS